MQSFSLTHFLYPTFSNNQKAKILHSSSLLILTVFIIAFQLIIKSAKATGIRILGYAANIPPEKIIELTNKKRTESGLSALSYNASLASAAKAKGDDMLAKDYWAHVAPDGTEPWAFFINVGYKYRYAGENLARDFSNSESAIEAWMASPSHRDNMLSGKYQEIGVAVVEGDLGGVDTTLIVQLLGTKLEGTADIAVAQAKTQVTPTSTISGTVNSLLTPTGTVTYTPTPTVIMPLAITSPVPTTPSENLVASPVTAGDSGKMGVLISPFDTTRGVSLGIIVVLLTVMVIDGIVTHKKGIIRIGGRTFAHMVFLCMVLIIIVLAKAGEIL